MINDTQDTVKHVFIDTCIYKGASFDLFDNYAFRELLTLCRYGKCKLYITSIVKREILARLNESHEELSKTLNKVKSSVKMVSKELDALFTKAENEFKLTAVHRFEKFLDETNCYELDIEGVDIERLFDMYFDKKPPFKSKPKEFPDATNLLAIENFIEEEELLESKFYFVTADKDFEPEIKGLVFAKSLPEFLNAISDVKERIINSIDLFFSDPLNLKEIESELTNYVENVISSANLKFIPPRHRHKRFEYVDVFTTDSGVCRQNGIWRL
ncbi:PIN domain-containing protein [Pseudoalteromonas maricaloris]